MSAFIINRLGHSALELDKQTGELDLAGDEGWAGIQLTRYEASDLASALLQFVTHGTRQDVTEGLERPVLASKAAEPFDPKKHPWGIDAAWEGPGHPTPPSLGGAEARPGVIGAEARPYATGGRLIAGGSPASGTISPIFAGSFSTDSRALAEGRDNLALLNERRIAA